MEEDLHRESRAYFSELKKRFETVVLNPTNFINNKLIFESLEFKNTQTPILIYPDAGRIFDNIYLSPYKTVCFHIDAFVGLHLRYGLAMSFDINVVFHPGFKQKFKKQGINNVIELAHAVEIMDVVERLHLKDRNIDVAFVGDLDRSIYSKRKEIIDSVNLVYPVAGIRAKMSIPEILNLYAQSRIVLNISRDDYLQDANLRCFEAMGNRSLLFSCTPSELEILGFEPGVHFIGIKSDEDWINKIISVLRNPDHFQLIADSGWKRTLDSNTYIKMVDRFINEIKLAIDSCPKEKKNHKRIYLGQVRYWTGHHQIFQSVKFAVYYFYAGGNNIKVLVWVFRTFAISLLINVLGQEKYLKLKSFIR